jgi:hypothetical protein
MIALRRAISRLIAHASFAMLSEGTPPLPKIPNSVAGHEAAGAKDQAAEAKDQAAEAYAGPLARLRRFVVPELRTKELEELKKQAIRQELEKSGDAVAPHFLEQARLRYDDVFSRAENIERRAGTLQTSIVFAVTLTLTGGALLLDSSKVPSDSWRDILAITVLVVVGVFVWSGLHTTWAATRTEYWKVVGQYSLQARKFDTLVDAQQHRAAAYLWCVQWNMAVNRWKAAELDRGLRAFVLGLGGLCVLAALVTAFALTHGVSPAQSAG